MTRRASPWDDPARRPSHADRRNAMRRQSLHNEFLALGLDDRTAKKLKKRWKQLVNLVA